MLGVLVTLAIYGQFQRQITLPCPMEAGKVARVITEKVKYDSDDPAIWLHPQDPSQSLVLGTDKNRDGALYVFDLSGRIIEEKTIRHLKRPNNVDVEYGLMWQGRPIDIAVVTENEADKIRIFKLPEMIAIDRGGIEVFSGETHRAPMGVGLFKRPRDGAIFAIISRKPGPFSRAYLWQYRLEDSGDGSVQAIKVREFGVWSGLKEIEAVCVDDGLGYVYYSDEGCGVRKYHADPDVANANSQLAFFATDGFRGDREGISIYAVHDSTGYILVSDQGANTFHVFSREGLAGQPHHHQRIKTLKLATRSSDGSEVCSAFINADFPAGLFIAMSDNRTFELYDWRDLAAPDLALAVSSQGY